jgi:hypothetical protein
MLGGYKPVFLNSSYLGYKPHVCGGGGGGGGVI